MICLYDKFTTESDWESNNGLCVLDPISCVVTEVAGGQYELELEHPLDDQKKFLMLTEERLIKAPVPETIVPETVMPQLDVWRTTVQTSLRSRIPTKKYKNKYSEIIQMVANNQAAYTYASHAYYNAGAIVLYGSTNKRVYRAKKGSYNIDPTNFFVWEDIGSLSDGNPTIDAGTVIETLSANAEIYKISDVNGSYIKARAKVSGKVGFVAVSACTVTTAHYQEIIPEQVIREQMFRIYETSCDEETNTMTVRAKHISYDFARNCLYDCKVTSVSPNEAISSIQSALMYDDDRVIACNITSGSITKDWSFKNPINALLDPDGGLLNALNARLVRNNRDFYIIDYSSPRDGITIEYGVNMLGVEWTRTTENIATRVIPRSGTSDKGYTYISNGGRISGGEVQDQGKAYVESEIADEYAQPIIYVLNCSYQVGQKYTNTEGDTVTYDEDTVLQKMRTEAKEKFTKYGIDGAGITLDVQFLLLGDTAEYQQYKGLQSVNLYDNVKILTGKSSIDANARVTEYEYDCLLGRYNSIKLGTINSFNRRVPGYRVVNESVTYEKLAPDLINRIVTENASDTTDSSGGSSAGGDAQPLVTQVVDELTSTSTTAALSANQGRVLNSHYQAIGASSNPCSDLDDLPLNSTGNVVFAGSISPTGTTRSCSYWKSGLSETRYSIVIVDQYDNRLWEQTNYDGTLSGWHQADYRVSVIDNLNSTSTTDALSANQGNVLNDKASMTVGTNASISDFNNAQNGLQFVTSSTMAHAPDTGGYWFIMTYAHTAGGRKMQMAMQTTTGKVYVRGYGSSAGWGSWTQL